MVLKNTGQNSVQIESSNSVAIVRLKDCVELSFEDNSISFDKPGEYEHQGIYIILKEVRETGFVSCANTSRVIADGVRVLFVLDSVDLKQDDLSSLLDIDILVVKETNLAKLNNLVKSTDPKKVAIILDTMKVNEITDLIRKTFTNESISSEKQIKSKEEEFTSENFNVEFILLK